MRKLDTYNRMTSSVVARASKVKCHITLLHVHFIRQKGLLRSQLYQFSSNLMNRCPVAGNCVSKTSVVKVKGVEIFFVLGLKVG